MANNNQRRLKALRSVAEVFEALGGTQGIADFTGFKYKTVHNWASLYNRFPARTYLLLQGRLKKEGFIGDPKLWRML